MRALTLTFVALLACAGAMAFEMPLAPQATQVPATPLDAAKVKAGMDLYATLKCSTCHLIGGVGNKLYPLDGIGAKMTAADIRLWMTDPAAMEAKLPTPPRLKMSTWMRTKKLPPADVDALVAYMQSLR